METLIRDAIDHWLYTLADANELRLPALVSPATGPEIIVVESIIPEELMAAIKSMAGNKELNVFKLFLGGVGLVLWKYTSQTDLVIAVPPLLLPDTDPCRCGTLYCRIKLDETWLVHTYFQRVHAILNEAHGNSEYDEAVFRDRYDQQEGRLLSLQGAGFCYNSVSAPGTWLNDHSIVFELIEDTNARIRVTCRRPLWPAAMLRNMIDSLLLLVSNFKANRDKPLTGCNIVPQATWQSWQKQFTANTRNYPIDKTVVDLFVDCAGNNPEKTALLWGGESMTYQALNELSHRIARLVGGEKLVGVLMQRSTLLVAAIVGILRAGAAYIPLGESYPPERIRDILQNARCSLVLHDGHAIAESDEGCRWVNMNSLPVKDMAMQYPEDGSGGQYKYPQPGDLAYIIFSSGTTGIPKGIMMEHGAIMHLLYWYKERYNITDDTRIVHLTNIVIDIAFQEIFSALTNGLTLYIPKKEESQDKALFIDYLNRHRINFIQLIPDMLYEYLADVPRLKYLEQVLCGGDKLSDTLKDTIAGKGYRLYNIYGQTETAIDTVGAVCVPGIPMRFNEFVPNYDVWIVDEYGKCCPEYVAGEIITGGPGLARGYLGQPQLTEAKFIPHPWKAGCRIYRTGDRGRRLPDGSIELLGRMDEQVKIRGFSVELSEIENALQAHKEIDTAIVVSRNKAGQNELVAYFTGAETVTVQELQFLLGQSLPVYMLPNHFVRLEKWPLTPAGKVNRKQLPDPEGISLGSGVGYVAPRTDVESSIVSIWQQLLGKEKIGIQDGFFDAGGDSIKILRLMNELKKALNLTVSFADIYRLNTIENIAAHILQNRQLIEQQNLQMNNAQAAVEAQLLQLRQTVLAGIPNQDEIADVYPMSDIEKGIVYESLFNAGVGVYHDLAIHERVFGDFALHRFQRALELLAEKHSILRTSFDVTGFEVAVQLVHKTIPVIVPYRDLSQLNLFEQETTIRDFIKASLAQPFDVARAPLWRMAAFNCGEGKTVFVSEAHHAIMDGWSDASFMTELNNVYLQLGNDPDYRPQPLQSDYRDFIVRQEIDKNDPAVRRFWQEELSEYSRLDLFLDKEEKRSYSYNLQPEQVKKLEQTAAALNVTVKDISLSAYLYLLKVLNWGNDMVAGLVTNARPDCEDSDKVLGCFLNTIPLKMTVDGSMTGAGWATIVHRKLIALKEYERLSMPAIAQLHHAPTRTGNPFFDTIFNYVDFYAYDNIKEQKDTASTGTSNSLANIAGNGQTNTYFDLDINRTGGLYNICIRLTRKLKCGFSPERLGAIYGLILMYIANDPDGPLREINCLGKGEAHQLLHAFNATTVPYDGNRTIVHLVEAQAERTPDAGALLCGQKKITYSMLDQAANRLAHYVESRYGIGAGCLVGIRLQRNEGMIMAILGVLKTGAAYVPIDPGYPQERINYIITDSQCTLVIDEVELTLFSASAELYPATSPGKAILPSDLAYVIYTSGSTGKPKGVMIEHRSVIAFINWCMQEFASSRFDTLLAVTSICFDLSIFEIFYPLSIGKKLRVLPDALSIANYLNSDEALLLNTVPAVVGSLLAQKADLRAVSILNMAGEPVPANYSRVLDCGSMEVRNLYGPSEDTTYSTVCRIRQNEPITIGRPIANTQIYILRDEGCDNALGGGHARVPGEGQEWRLCPVGIVGEICIGGAGLARGYLNQVELTKEKFADNPFRPWERMYRTGDLGRWLEDGSIEFIGRRDEQVKIRGFRIEPGEIEQVLQLHPAIGAAAVVARSITGDGGAKELVAYVTGRPGIDGLQKLSLEDIRKYLKERLPAYMVPGQWVELDAMPLTPNGKTDRRRLPAPVVSGMHKEGGYIAPRNKMEQQIAAVWEKVLNREGIGIRDNFFELGGHSLIAMRLLSCLNKATGVRYSLQDLYNRPTIEGLAIAAPDQGALVRLTGSHFQEKRNIYFVPPMFGNSILYESLAKRMQKEYNCYGLQYPGLDDQRLQGKSVEQMAATFSKEVLEVQHDNQCILFGYSMGVAIAFEMAKILEARLGPLVVILVDRGAVNPITNFLSSLCARKQAGNLISLYRDRIPSVEDIRSEELTHFLAHNIRMLGRYIQKGRIQSRLVLFEAADGTQSRFMKRWKKYTTGEVEHRQLTGGHWDALSGINLPQYEMVIRALPASPQQ